MKCEDNLCNLCGESLQHNISTDSGKYQADKPYGLHKAKVVGGYESYHLFDASEYEFSFCEKCLRQLFNQCKIKPTVNEHIFNEKYLDINGEVKSYESYENDQEQYEHRIWIDNGGLHRAYLNRTCNFVKDCHNKAIYTQLLNEEFTERCCCEEHKMLYPYTNSSLVKFISNIMKPFL